MDSLNRSFNSRFKADGTTKFGTEDRDKFLTSKFLVKDALNMTTPGPGYYQTFSDFGLYDPGEGLKQHRDRSKSP